MNNSSKKITISMLLWVVCVGCEKSPTTFPKYPLSNVDLVGVFINPSLADQKIMKSFKAIHGMLQDTLTDGEEAEVLRLIAVAKTDTVLNHLIEKLSDSGLLLNLIQRWDEERHAYKAPSLFDQLISKVSGGELPQPPQNITFRRDFLDAIFINKNLNEGSGRKVLTAFNGRSFNGSEDSNSGLQSMMMSVISSRRNKYGVGALSPDSKKLAREIFANLYGDQGFRSRVQNTRESLFRNKAIN